MQVIGITGNSGSGKSYISNEIIKYLESKVVQARLIDADEVVKKMQCGDTEYKKQIVKAFGNKILNDENEINRKALANIIFNDNAEKEKLDKLTNEYVVEDIKRQIKKTENVDYLILDVPLLFECKLNNYCDITIGVISSMDKKINRICTRDKITKEEALKRLNSQKDDEFYKNRCNFTIENNGDNDITKIIAEILQ